MTRNPFSCWTCWFKCQCLMTMVAAVILAALLFRLATRGPRWVSPRGAAGMTLDTTTTGGMILPRARVAIEPKFVVPCNNSYTNPGLPPELQPEEYAIKFTLRGGTASGMKISGRVDVPLTPKDDVDRIVLRADPHTLSAFRMALIEEPAAPRTRKRALDILSATPIPGKNFLVVCVREALIEGKTYTLVVEYEYRSPTSGTAPILISADTVRMRLHPLRAHAAFPCFEEDGWKARLRLTVQAPAGFTVISNTARKGRPVAFGALKSHVFEETVAMPLHKLAWVAFRSNTSEHTITLDMP